MVTRLVLRGAGNLPGAGAFRQSGECIGIFGEPHWSWPELNRHVFDANEVLFRLSYSPNRRVGRAESVFPLPPRLRWPLPGVRPSLVSLTGSGPQPAAPKDSAAGAVGLIGAGGKFD